MNNLKWLFEIIMMTIHSRNKAVKHFPYIFLPSNFCALKKMLESYHLRRIRRVCSPWSQLFKASLEPESQKGTPLFFGQIAVFSHFWKEINIFSQSPCSSSKQKIQLWDGCYLTQNPLFCSRSDFVSGPRSACIHFTLTNWWWRCGEAGKTEQRFLLSLP